MTRFREDFNDLEACISYPSSSIQFSNGFTIHADAGEHEVCVSNGVFIGDTHDETPEPEDGLDDFPSYNLFAFDQPIVNVTMEFTHIESTVDFRWEGMNRPPQFDFDQENTPLTIDFENPVDSFNIISGYAWYHMDYLEWTPVPEPSTGVLLSLALIGLAFWRKLCR